ncbi:penicillin-binding transpeptidase domain-containing protein [Micromonospora peucetia]|uniref:Cell division protein FtsI/penicillin-binding protein 2 n=1 Tax=Micromonospora peucetia TaxID=47871 RepID=A0A1C6VHI9_9ACTN|nr:penicillin-binding transpeptidase domain-containing protein [Micromonospora peucetia]MCX4389830.1 penicillin-binding transpeptidase domain-containing protein [Micromonospora peucetia]WSA30296.1 penicillin-binding transpeptidase domain-containing protein [Micromonospora peucetia]SCL65524.1 Cell division protein FtsI/penicillin-binding protein 2 [Micromonospora peucetia]
MRLSYPHRPRRNRLRPSLALLAATTLAAGALTACSGGDGPERSVDAFLAGWRSGDLQAVGFVDPTGSKVPAADVAREIKELSGELAATPPTLTRQGEGKVTKDVATAVIKVDWALTGQTRWTYDRQVRLTRGGDDDWRVIWEPQLVQEQLTRGDRLGLRRDTATRAAVLDGAGQPIVAPRPVVRVGLQPSEVTDLPGLTRKLDAAFRAIRPAITPPVDLSGLPKRLADADPGAFVEVVTLREEAYRQIKPRVHDLPGTKFRSDKLDLAPTREFARAVLGSVDQAQADDLAKHPDRYEAGDLVGHGGLQGRHDERLRGTPGLTVIVERPGPEGTLAPTGTEVFRSEPQPGQPLKTTLDVATQNAADTALRGEKRRAALVAVRISDGAVLAAANGPGAAGENLAFTAQVPPGSTFKMVSALGLLDGGAVTPETTVDCPKTLPVDGRSFKNSDNFELGPVPFRTDFAKSCNTAFAALAPKLGPDGLAVAGRSLGLEGQWDVGLDAFTGKVSANGGATEQAAAAIGQGTTVVSPLAMASATASVARGRFEQPKLVLDPAPAQPAAPGPQLKPESVEAVKAMMREVVTAGSGSALRDVPGAPVHGKTGTAEYDDNPANTHAWFVGWQGDVAFAVFVEKGGASTATAVPAAERFLRALPR